MAWCRLAATRHYLGQCWARSVPGGVLIMWGWWVGSEGIDPPISRHWEKISILDPPFSKCRRKISILDLLGILRIKVNFSIIFTQTSTLDPPFSASIDFRVSESQGAYLSPSLKEYLTLAELFWHINPGITTLTSKYVVYRPAYGNIIIPYFFTLLEIWIPRSNTDLCPLNWTELNWLP